MCDYDEDCRKNHSYSDEDDWKQADDQMRYDDWQSDKSRPY